MEEAWSNKLAAATTREERVTVQEAYDAIKEKIQKIKECTRMLIYYKDYVTAETWAERFDLPLDLFLQQVADTNLRIFMEMATEEDK